MTVQLDVLLTNQSFKDAGEKGIFPFLEMGSIFIAESKIGLREETFNHANQILEEKARRKGYTHIFGIEYTFEKERTPLADNLVRCIAIGTGYYPTQM